MELALEKAHIAMGAVSHIRRNGSRGTDKAICSIVVDVRCPLKLCGEIGIELGQSFRHVFPAVAEADMSWLIVDGARQEQDT